MEEGPREELILIRVWKKHTRVSEKIESLCENFTQRKENTKLKTVGFRVEEYFGGENFIPNINAAANLLFLGRIKDDEYF